MRIVQLLLCCALFMKASAWHLYPGHISPSNTDMMNPGLNIPGFAACSSNVIQILVPPPSANQIVLPVPSILQRTGVMELCIGSQ